METKFVEHSSDPEVVYAVVDHSNYPEVVSEGAVEIARPPRRICGLKKRTFYAVAAVLLVVVVVLAATLGAVLGRRKSNPAEETRGPGDQESLPSTKSDLRIPSIANSSRLAALATPDGSGTTYRLFFSVTGSDGWNGIQEAQWTSNSNSWSVANVTTDAIQYIPRNDTPLYGYYDSGNRGNFTSVYFIDEDNTVRALSATDSTTSGWLWGTVNEKAYIQTPRSSLVMQRTGAPQNSNLLYVQAIAGLAIGNWTSGVGWQAYDLPSNNARPGSQITSAIHSNDVQTVRAFYTEAAGVDSDVLKCFTWNSSSVAGTDGWRKTPLAEPISSTSVISAISDNSKNTIDVVISTPSDTQAAGLRKITLSLSNSSPSENLEGAIVSSNDKKYTALSSTTDGQLFALFTDSKGLGIEWWERDAESNWKFRDMVSF